MVNMVYQTYLQQPCRFQRFGCVAFAECACRSVDLPPDAGNSHGALQSPWLIFLTVTFH